MDGRGGADPRGAHRRDVHQAPEHPESAQLHSQRVLPVGLDKRTGPPNGKKLTICVQGRQFIWRYTYGNGCLSNAFASKLPYSFQEMVVPAQTTVILDIQSTDVIHSWWIPQLGGKVDAVPGYTTYTWFKAPGPMSSTAASAPSCAGVSTPT